MHIPTVIKGEGEREEAKLGRNLLFRGLKFRSSVCVGITSFFLLLVLQCLHPYCCSTIQIQTTLPSSNIEMINDVIMHTEHDVIL